MSRIINNTLKEKLSEFYDGYVINKNDDKMAEHIIVREALPNSYKIKNNGIYAMSKNGLNQVFTYKEDDKGNIKFIHDNTMMDINSYGTKEEVLSSYKASPRVNTNDNIWMSVNAENIVKDMTSGESKGHIVYNKIKEKNVYWKGNGWNGIVDNKSENPKMDIYPIDREVVELITGIRVKVYKDSDYNFRLDVISNDQRKTFEEFKDNLEKVCEI
jgi:hypothetical protein